MNNRDWFRSTCQQNGFIVTNEQLEKLEAYSELLLDWNRKINLISRKDEENLWTNHLFHSASILLKLCLPKNVSVLDLGTGGGLPGIPLKILQPEITLTLLDSAQKKIKVVQSIIESLSLTNTVTVWGRAEQIGAQASHRKRYDIIVARGVGNLKDLVTWAWPLVKERRGVVVRAQDQESGGKEGHRIVEPPALLALKGGDLKREVESARRDQHIRSMEIVDLDLIGSTQLAEQDKKIVIVSF